MFAYLLLIGGLLYGSAAFAGGRVYALAAVVTGALALGAWGGSRLRRVISAGTWRS